jgi:hypothetical protein
VQRIVGRSVMAKINMISSNSDHWINNLEFTMVVRSQYRQEEHTGMEDRSWALDPSARIDHRRIQENLHDL